MSVTVDPIILVAFGEPPEGMDLTEERYTLYNVIVSIILGVAVASVALRLYVRRQKGPRLGLDDYAIIFSTICSGATVAMTVLAGQHGAGTHIWVNTLPSLMTLLKVVYSEPYIYALTVTGTKLSILLFYRRLFYSKNYTRGIFYYLYWMAFFLASAYPFVLWITMACACRPVSYYWNQYIGAEGYCIDVKLFFLALGIVNMLNDVVILLVPIPRIIDLQLSKRLKASVIGIMLLGGFVCVASIVRIYYLYGLFSNVDATWWVGSAMAWSSIEPSVAIISACLPTFAPLFRVTRSRRHESSPYYISDRTDASRLGPHLTTKSKRSNGRLGMPGTLRMNAMNFMIEEDEQELTCKVTSGGSMSSRDLESKGKPDDDGGIVVSTRVTVTTSERNDYYMEELGSQSSKE